MKNFLKILLMSFVSSFSINPLYAFDLFSIIDIFEEESSYVKTEVYGIDLSNNSKTKLTEKDIGGGAGMNSFVSPSTGELILVGASHRYAYSWASDNWRTVDDEIFEEVPLVLAMPTSYGQHSSNVISIGKNSLKLKETATTQEMWATDASGNIAPIDITHGSKLLINGVSVQDQLDSNNSNISTNTSNISTNTSNIKNLGEGVAGSTALTAALSALPQTSKESKISCGVGTGAYSSRYAVGFGCASKINERFDLNAGGSYVFGGSKSYGGGTLDSGVVKAGFVFKLGELSKPTQISFKDKKIIDQKIFDLEKNNKNLKAKNDEIISQNHKLLARLEKLENIAFKLQKNEGIKLSKGL